MKFFRCAFYTTLVDYCKTQWKWSRPQCNLRLKVERTKSTGKTTNFVQIVIAWTIQGGYEYEALFIELIFRCTDLP